MKQIINEVASEFNVTKKNAGELVDFIINSIVTETKETKKLKINGFGTFTVKTKAARKARNPKTGEEIDVPEKIVVAFKAAKALNEFVAS